MKTLDSIIGKFIRGVHIAGEMVPGAILTIISIVCLISTNSIKLPMTSVSPLDNARFAPRLVFGALLICSLVMIFKGFRAMPELRKTAPEGEALADSVIAFKRGVIALGAIALMIALIKPLGFIPAAIVYLFCMMLFMSAKEGWKLKLYIIAAILVPIVLYILFKNYVYVTMPQGILKGIL